MVMAPIKSMIIAKKHEDAINDMEKLFTVFLSALSYFWPLMFVIQGMLMGWECENSTCKNQLT